VGEKLLTQTSSFLSPTFIYHGLSEPYKAVPFARRVIIRLINGFNEAYHFQERVSQNIFF